MFTEHLPCWALEHSTQPDRPSPTQSPQSGRAGATAVLGMFRWPALKELARCSVPWAVLLYKVFQVS